MQGNISRKPTSHTKKEGQNLCFHNKMEETDQKMDIRDEKRNFKPKNNIKKLYTVDTHILDE